MKGFNRYQSSGNSKEQFCSWMFNAPTLTRNQYFSAQFSEVLSKSLGCRKAFQHSGWRTWRCQALKVPAVTDEKSSLFKHEISKNSSAWWRIVCKVYWKVYQQLLWMPDSFSDYLLKVVGLSRKKNFDSFSCILWRKLRDLVRLQCISVPGEGKFLIVALSYMIALAVILLPSNN